MNFPIIAMVIAVVGFLVFYFLLAAFDASKEYAIVPALLGAMILLFTYIQN